MPAKPSSWNQIITEKNPNNRYKFTSIEINPSLNQKIIARDTYHGLDFMGDLGGLFDAFLIIGNIFI